MSHTITKKIATALARLQRVRMESERITAAKEWLCRAALFGCAMLAPTLASAQTVVRYLHTDALGSVVAKTDADGNVVERITYEPYGAALDNNGGDGPGYTGHVSDAATGLSYMQQRYMDPQLGIFLSVDPVTAYSQPVGQFNRYRYANGNPYGFTDPDGRTAAALPLLVMPIIVGAGYYVATTPAQRAELGRSIDQGIKELLQRNESTDPGAEGSDSGGSSGPSLPTGLVGDQTSPLAGPNKSGNRHTSGNLTPSNGGTGNYDQDLTTLAGETRPAARGDRAPEGAKIGANGVFGRDTNSSGGKSIDVPTNGDKPHETLHYD